MKLWSDPIIWYVCWRLLIILPFWSWGIRITMKVSLGYRIRSCLKKQKTKKKKKTHQKPTAVPMGLAWVCSPVLTQKGTFSLSLFPLWDGQNLRRILCCASLLFLMKFPPSPWHTPYGCLSIKWWCSLWIQNNNPQNVIIIIQMFTALTKMNYLVLFLLIHSHIKSITKMKY